LPSSSCSSCFLTLEITEIVMAWGDFNGDPAGSGLLAIGGWLGVLTTIVAWYTSAAIVANPGRPVAMFPVGTPICKL
jgi:hypothetical protein